MKGYFGVGIYRPKRLANVGILYRSAYIMGASWVFTIGQRYTRQASDTTDTTSQIPLYEYETFDQLLTNLPKNVEIVAVEQGGQSLDKFSHPRRAIYLMGAEDHGLPSEMLNQCNYCVEIPSLHPYSLNVGVAGSIVLYDRLFKLGGVKRELA